MPFQNVLLVDQSVPDYQVFLNSVNGSTCVILYSSRTTKSELYAMIREKTDSAERLAIVSLKDDLFVDMTPLTQSKEVFTSLVSEHPITRIDFLACNTLEDPDYKHFYEALERETSVVVGASSDLTGNVKYGGDWVMENTKEDIQQVYFTEAIENYPYLLDSQETLLYVKNNILYGLGNNNTSQAGIAGPSSAGPATLTTPTQITFVDSSGNSLVSMIKQISYGANHTVILLTNGTVWASGLNSSGQLGLGNFLNINSFTRVNISDVVQVSCGRLFTMLVKSDGTLWGTGLNAEGQLGIGEFTIRNVFTQVNISDVVQVSAGNIHTMALKKDGTLLGTGYSFWFGIISADYVNVFTPVNLTDVAKVSSGWNHTSVLKRDGTVWGVGGNQNGQLGVNDFLNKLNTYVQVDISNVEDIFCGANHVAILKGGTVWTTGLNGNGQLGLNSTTNVAIFINTNRQAKTINCGRRCTILVDNDYTLWGAGDSSAGLLATTGNRTTFVTIATLVTARFPSRLINFSIPIQTDLTTRTMTLTNPTSNSDGTFTYSSSQPGVAMVTNGTLTILTGGKTVLYVRQAFTTTYDESFLFYELNTNYLFTPTTLTSFSTTATTSRTIQIPPPTSSRVGTFTYTSSNPNVATVTANMISIKSKGTTTITAYQPGTSIHQDASISSVLDTSPSFVDDYYQTVVSNTTVTLPTGDNTYNTVMSNDAKLNVTLVVPFVFRGVEITQLVLDVNGSILLGISTPLVPALVYNSITTGTYSVPAIHPFYTNLTTDSYLSSKYIAYKETSDTFILFFNAAFAGDPSNTTSQVIMKITLFLKSSPNSGNILIEYGNMIASSTSISNLSSSMPRGFLSGITFAPYDTTTTFTTDDWFTQNLQRDINTPNVRYYPFTQAQLTAISNKSITYIPSKRKIIPTLQSWSIPSNSTSRVIRLTPPISNNSQQFSYSTSDASIATIENGRCLLLYKSGTVNVIATQASNALYDSANISVKVDPSYFTFVTDICFSAGTPILTDQGTFPIETLTTQTLNKKPIVRVTKTLGTEEQLVCFEKDALGKDQPSQLTVMTMNHRLEKDGKMVKAKECLNGTTVHAEWYMGEYLYNVLLETHSVMNVNGLICETLDPENDVAKFYA